MKKILYLGVFLSHYHRIRVEITEEGRTKKSYPKYNSYFRALVPCSETLSFKSLPHSPSPSLSLSPLQLYFVLLSGLLWSLDILSCGCWIREYHRHDTECLYFPKTSFQCCPLADFFPVVLFFSRVFLQSFHCCCLQFQIHSASSVHWGKVPPKIFQYALADHYSAMPKCPLFYQL